MHPLRRIRASCARRGNTWRGRGGRWRRACQVWTSIHLELRAEAFMLGCRAWSLRPWKSSLEVRGQFPPSPIAVAWPEARRLQQRWVGTSLASRPGLCRHRRRHRQRRRAAARAGCRLHRWGCTGVVLLSPAWLGWKSQCPEDPHSPRDVGLRLRPVYRRTSTQDEVASVAHPRCLHCRHPAQPQCGNRPLGNLVDNLVSQKRASRCEHKASLYCIARRLHVFGGQ